jgi:hypothetical protein
VYFRGPDGFAAVAVVERGGALEPGVPERLPFPKDSLRLDSRVFSPDGRRFLVERYASDAIAEPFRLIRSWRKAVER